MSYTVDVFYINWDKPQISSSLPSGNLAVYNANTAVSKGFEFETSGPVPSWLRVDLFRRLFLCRCEADQRLLPAGERGRRDHAGRPLRQIGRAAAGKPEDQPQRRSPYDTPLTPGYDLACP